MNISCFVQIKRRCFIINFNSNRRLEILPFHFLPQGIIGSGLGYVGMSWCIKQRGPVFTSSFTPFIQIFAAMFDFSFLHEQIYLGRLVPSITHTHTRTHTHTHTHTHCAFTLLQIIYCSNIQHL